MTLQTFPGTHILMPHPWHQGGSPQGVQDSTLDAVNEGLHLTGSLHLPPSARGSSHTISSAGGKLYVMIGGTTTFANASSIIRAGIQDVAVAGNRGDGTHDVYDDLVGGTDTLTSTTEKVITMSNGSKTLSHGDEIAVVFKMTGFGGADSVKLRMASVSGSNAGFQSHWPACTFETAAGTFGNVLAIPWIAIEFDDGVFGFIDGGVYSNDLAIATPISIGLNSSPDEVAAIFDLASPVQIGSVWGLLNPSSAAADFELIIYSDPEGTPVAERTIAVDATKFLLVTFPRMIQYPLTSLYNTTGGSKFAVAFRPTVATTTGYYRYSVASAAMMDGLPLGQRCYYGQRTNQTGAFAPTTTLRPMLGFGLAGLNDASPQPTFAIGGIP